MGPGEAIASVMFFSTIITIIVVLAGANKRKAEYRLREKELEVQARQGATPRRSEDYELLEQRVRVLERIATDRTPDLATQIEALRDCAPALERKEPTQ